MPLSSCASKSKVRVARVTNQQPDFLRYLADNGLNLGSTITVESNSTEAGIVTAKVGRKQVSLGHPVAEQLLVEILDEHPRITAAQTPAASLSPLPEKRARANRRS